MRGCATKASAATVALAFLMYGCGGNPSTPTTPSATTDSSSPSARLFNGIAATLTGDGVIGAIATSPNRDMLGIATETGASGQIVKVTGATFILPNGGSAVVYPGSDGLPARAVFGDVAVTFSNYTNNTVDIVMMAANGAVTIARGVAVDANQLADLRSLMAQLSASARSSVGTRAVTDAQVAILYKTSGTLLSVAGCAASVSALAPTLGLSTFIMAGTCTSAFVKVLTLIDPALDSPLLTASGGLMSGVNCFGIESAPACLSFVMAALKLANLEAEVHLSPPPAPVPTPPQNRSGNWRATTAEGVTIAFVVSDTRILSLEIAFPSRDIGCLVQGFTTSGRTAPIVGNEFSLADVLRIDRGASGQIIYEWSIRGTFTSSGSVSGTASLKYTNTTGSPFCSENTLNTSWTATKAP